MTANPESPASMFRGCALAIALIITFGWLFYLLAIYYERKVEGLNDSRC